jgi:hypothetical protein
MSGSTSSNRSVQAKILMLQYANHGPNLATNFFFKGLRNILQLRISPARRTCLRRSGYAQAGKFFGKRGLQIAEYF